MSQSLETRIQKLQEEFQRNLQELQSTGNYGAIGELSQKLQAEIEALVQQETVSLEEGGPHLELVTEHVPFEYYRHQETKLQLESIVYDGDRQYFEKFLNNPKFAFVKDFDAKNPMARVKKDLLKHTLRLTRTMAPKVFNAIKRCQDVLGLESKVEIFLSQDSRINAGCYPPHENSVYLIITSAAVEKLSEDELTFVIGHELGHHLYQHHMLNVGHVQNTLGHNLSPAEMVRLLSWYRNCELTADRIGLICCGSYEVACLAHFKASSGISSDAVSFSLDEYKQQYAEMEKEMQNEASLEDFYSTHPLNPLRIISLDLFARSEEFMKIVHPGKAFEYSEAELEEKIAGYMRLMEPKDLNQDDQNSKNIREMMFFGGLAVATADGKICDEELKYLANFLPACEFDELAAKAKTWNLDMIMSVFAEYVEKVFPHLSNIDLGNIVRDLTYISVSDGELSRAELYCLYDLAQMLRVHPSFVDQVLNSLQQAA